MFCTKCGAVVDEKTGVCPNCGACERAEEKAEKPDSKKKLISEKRQRPQRAMP